MISYIVRHNHSFLQPSVKAPYQYFYSLSNFFSVLLQCCVHSHHPPSALPTSLLISVLFLTNLGRLVRNVAHFTFPAPKFPTLSFFQHSGAPTYCGPLWKTFRRRKTSLSSMAFERKKTLAVELLGVLVWNLTLLLDSWMGNYRTFLCPCFTSAKKEIVLIIWTSFLNEYLWHL